MKLSRKHILLSLTEDETHQARICRGRFMGHLAKPAFAIVCGEN